MSFRRFYALLFAALLFMGPGLSPGSAETAPAPQYLLFQIFTGAPAPDIGVFHRGLTKDDIEQAAKRIADTVRVAPGDPNRILGFSVGPIAMDEGPDEAKSVIRDAVDVALDTNMAVAVHLDDYMFWAMAHRTGEMQLLRDVPGATEWKDWQQTPSDGLDVEWMRGINLAPQMCYESPDIRSFVDFWLKDSIGPEIKKQYDRLVAAGKPQLFAGVIVGWESNLSDGYCSLAQLGYSAQKPPADFDHERERILQRHIEHWAKDINDLGIPRDLIFTHVAPIPRKVFDKIHFALPADMRRQLPGSTAFHAYWTAFNAYSTPGFSAYTDGRGFDDIYNALRTNNGKNWAMVEGAAGAGKSDLGWEEYLARNFNHGARIVNIYGGFQGQSRTPDYAVESDEALAAYRKFLKGESLLENVSPSPPKAQTTPSPAPAKAVEKP